MKIINLTQHEATAEQLEAGVVDFDKGKREYLLRCLTVDPESLLIIGDDLLSERAARILNDFVLPEQVRQCESLLAEEWDAGRCGVSAPATGVAAINSVINALCVHVMVGGFPPLTEEIKKQAKQRNVVCHDALSARESVDVPQPDGSVRKTAVFRHVGFWPPIN